MPRSIAAILTVLELVSFFVAFQYLNNVNRYLSVVNAINYSIVSGVEPIVFFVGIPASFL